jgi:hypothetical protein
LVGDIFKNIQKERHRATITTRGLHPPFLPFEILFMEQHGSLSWLFDISLSSLDMFEYDLANCVDGLISIDL